MTAVNGKGSYDCQWIFDKVRSTVELATKMGRWSVGPVIGGVVAGVPGSVVGGVVAADPEHSSYVHETPELPFGFVHEPFSTILIKQSVEFVSQGR